MNDDVSKLTHLGGKSEIPDKPTALVLETFESPYPGEIPNFEYEIRHETDEFTSLCPKTNQPDYATILIIYRPFAKCIESKSLKLYLASYRNHGSFMESIVNDILRDLVKVCEPEWCYVVGEFKSRGGIRTVVDATYSRG